MVSLRLGSPVLRVRHGRLLAIKGCHDGAKNGDLSKLSQLSGAIQVKSIQLKLVEDVVASRIVRRHRPIWTISLVRHLQSKPRLALFVTVAYRRYNANWWPTTTTPARTSCLEQGRMAMAPTDQMVLQGQIAIDQAVRLLEKAKAMSSGGAPEYNNNPDRITEHVQPVPIVVTKENLRGLRSRLYFGARMGGQPVFRVD